MILQDHVIKESCDFVARIASRQVISLPSLVAIGAVVVECARLLLSLIFALKNMASAQPEIFQGRGGFAELALYDKHFVKNTRKKDEKTCGVFSSRYS